MLQGPAHQFVIYSLCPRFISTECQLCEHYRAAGARCVCAVTHPDAAGDHGGSHPGDALLVAVIARGELGKSAGLIEKCGLLQAVRLERG